MATATLPPSLGNKLASLARRIRLLRAVRGLSLLLLVLLVLGGAALLADASLGLPAVVRGGLLLAWVAVGAVTGYLVLLRPLAQPLHPEALAALVEEKYPDLGERLTSAVELAGEADGVHGSPALIALLLRETEARAHRLDVFQAFPPRLAIGLAGAALAALLAAVAPAVVWPQRYAELGRRFLTPWQTAARVVPYALDVTPGDAFTAKGRPFTITARALPLDTANPALPRSSVLVTTDPTGEERRQPMLVERPDTFAVRLDAVAGDFTYRVEAGEAVSDTYRITAVAPADLGDGAAVHVTPPAYAKGEVEPESFPALADLTVLEHSRLRFDLRLTRPVVAATLELTQGGREKAATHTLELAPDRQGGTLELPAATGASLRLLLAVEHGVRTEIGRRFVTVRPDQPPAFVKVAGPPPALALRDEPTPVSRDDTMPLEMTVADDLGVARLAVEVRINEGQAAEEPVALASPARQVTARHVLTLAERELKEGDVLRYRLKAADTRQVPEAKLGPNVTYHPADRWLTLRVSRSAAPLKQQETTAQRDDLARRLDAIKQDLLKEQRTLAKLREEAQTQEALTPAQQQALEQLRRENRDSETALRELARDAAETPATRPLAALAQDVANKELQQSDQALRTAQKEARPGMRNDQLRDADKEVANAIRRLEELRKVNEQLAQQQLDQLRLEQLAQRQQDLADRTAEHAQRDPVKDPAKPEAPEALKRDQGEIANDLNQLTEKSDRLRDALDAARAEQAKQLAAKARDLAKAQRDLSAAEKKAAAEAKLDELARKQQELAEKATDLAKDTRLPAQAARTVPFRPDDPRKAAEALKQGDAGVAMRHQEQAARDLERLAGDFERAADQARDPREAARQLARLQDGIRQQLQERVKNHDPKTLLAPKLKPEQQAEAALQRAVEDLPVPAEQKAAQQEQKKAVEKTRQAARALYKPNAPEADAAMREAKAALDRLADKMPSLAERQRQAREEVAKLRRQQDEIARQAEKALKDKPEASNQRRNEAAKRQTESAQRLGKLDTPGQQAQRDATKEALEEATAALREGEPKAMEASQREAKGQLERLEKALAERQTAAAPAKPPPGDPEDAPGPPDLPRREQSDAARQIAKEQRQLRDEVQRLLQQLRESAKAGEQEAMEKATGQLQQDTNRLAQQMGRTPQAQQAAQQAAEAERRAQSAMKQAQGQQREGNRGQMQRSQEQSARALDQAADGLERAAGKQGGQEDDLALPAGKSVQQAQGQMTEAQSRLGQSQNQAAQGAMQRAAEALRQAAQAMNQNPSAAQSEPQQPPDRGADGGGAPDLSAFGAELKPHAGKRWGELPGELRTRIVQDLKARYGDDYARVIKLYFEQIADTKRK